MKRLLLALLLLLSAGAHAQEIIQLTTPIIVNKSNYRVDTITIGSEVGIINIVLKADGDATPLICTYHAGTTPTGAALIIGLNKANLSTPYAGNATTGSLRQRIAHRLVVMGEAAAVCGQPLAGTLTGSVP